MKSNRFFNRGQFMQAHENQLKHWVRQNVLIGVGLWGIIVLLQLLGVIASNQIDLFVLLGINGLVPLSLYLTVDIKRDGHLLLIAQLPFRIQIVVVLMTTIALLQPIGWIGGVFAVAWFAQSVFIFLSGVSRFLSRPATSLDMLCIDAGYAYVLVSGIWFVAYRGSGELLGFTGSIVPLTVAHFTFISLGGLVIAGMIGHQLRLHHQSLLLYRITAWVIILSPAWIAIGFVQTLQLNHVGWIEVIGVIGLTGSYISLAILYLFRIRQTIPHRFPRYILNISISCLFFTMLLAFGYMFGQLTAWWVLTIPTMLTWHGWLNAVGFAGLGILGWCLVKPSINVNASDIPFSRLPWRWRIGANFLTDIDAIDTQKQTPSGIVDDFSSYATPDCDIQSLSPHIRNFYEQTQHHHLIVHPQWTRLFRLPARFYKQVSRRMGQMNLPLNSVGEETAIDSQIVPLKDELDGRDSVRGWIRTYTHTQEAVYVAAYSSHHDDLRPYMNIAFPLVGGSLTSILRLSTQVHDRETMLHLTSLPSEDYSGDQGVYWVNRLLTIRLPINETIDVFPVAYDDLPEDTPVPDQACVFARHRMWLFGIKFLTLHYLIESVEND